MRTDIALSMDDREEEAYLIRALTYESINEYKQAEENYEIALSINPNYSLGLRFAANFYLYYLHDYVKGFLYLHKAADIDRTPYLAIIQRSLSSVYNQFGFYDKAIHYNQEATKLDEDSISYFMQLSGIENYRGSREDVLNYRLEAYRIDTNNTRVLRFLASSFGALGKNEESLKYWRKYISLKNARGEKIEDMAYIHIGSSFWRNGYKEEALFYFNEQINICNIAIEARSSSIAYAASTEFHYRLAQVYAYLGDKVKAFENLRILNQVDGLPAWIHQQIKYTFYFNDIRDEPEFQQILREVDAKFQEEHNKVRQWLVANDML